MPQLVRVANVLSVWMLADMACSMYWIMAPAACLALPLNMR